MAKTASEIQKERIAEIETKAEKLLDNVNIAALTSINENGYPRTCLLTKARNEGFSDIYFITSKRSKLNGKATHFEQNPKASVSCFSGGDSVTLIGNVEFVEERELQEAVWKESDRRFFSKGIDDPKFRLLKQPHYKNTYFVAKSKSETAL